ncbi:tetratricopeptide repeat protein [Ascidiimonas sp. W6]|uniref:ATP-binding protein n=1 Tax=Ascidiimonas meishanensis TaxID=3128903 RepID=UPI0030EF4FA1
MKNLTILFFFIGVFSLILLTFSCKQTYPDSIAESDHLRDSINSFIELSLDAKLSEVDRINYAKEAFNKSKELAQDSIYIKSGFNLARALFSNDKEEFKRFTLIIKNYSEKVKDSFGIGKASSYLGNYYYNISKNDSAYFHFYEATKMLRKIKKERELADALLNMSIIQKNEKDFIAGEVASIEAIPIYKKLKDDEQLSSVYNNLGIISNELKDYDKAIEYHNKSLDYAKIAGVGSKSEITSLNNLGVVYQNLEMYAKAIEYYEKALSFEKIDTLHTKQYAMLLDNLSYAQLLLGETQGLPEFFLYSLKIRDSIGDVPGQIINNVHIAEFYLSQQDTLSAKKYVTDALTLAEDTQSYGDMLTPLKLLSDIDNGKDGWKAAKQHMEISESLQEAERKIRNKFARIRFETDQIEQKNKEISKQKDLFIGISAVLLMFGIFIYIIRKQQEKNKELKFSKAQQEKNEEIYNLMLSQQQKLEEGRQQEKKRISQELHDGVLSKLFGTRLNLDSLNLRNDEQTIQTRTKYIDELKSIEQEIRQISHDLNTEIYDSNLGYTEVISNLISSQAQLGNLEYKFQSDSHISWETMSNKVKIHLYRIIQEALQNINKHANARNIKLTFKKNDDSLQIDISDDGVGFDSNKIKNGIGLKNIKSRVKEIGGKLQLNSAVGGGTNISINVSA